MNRRMIRTGLILCFLILAPDLALSQVVHYVFQEYPPANYLDNDDKPVGFFVDIIREAVENRLGYNLRISVFPWMRCQVLVRQGKADLMTTIPTPARLEYTRLIPVPIWVKQYSIYTYRGHPRREEMNEIRNIAEILESQLTVISYIGNSWVKTNLEHIGIQVLDATTVEGMYRMLIARRGDIIIDDPILVTNTLITLGFENQIVSTGGMVEEEAFYPMVSRQSSLATRTEDFAAVLQDMWDDGTIEAIMETYR